MSDQTITLEAGVPFSFDQYDDVLGFVVSQAAHILSRQLSAAIHNAGFDITPREFAVLNRLHQYGALNPSQLAQLTYKDRPAVTRMLDKLIKRKYVEKTQCRDDGRALKASLTATGDQARAAIVPLAVDMLKSDFADVSHQDLMTTLKTLKSLTEKFNIDSE